MGVDLQQIPMNTVSSHTSALLCCILFPFSSYQVISVAALCLAGKVNDEPRPFKNLTVEMFKQWYRAGDNPEVKAKLYDVIWLEGMYSAVLNAEWCLMHALDFDFNVDLVHSEVAKALKLPSLEQVKDVPKLQQAVVSCCNDVMKKDGTLVLQYPVWELALVIIDFMAQRFHSMDDTRPLPNPDAEGRPWYVGAGLSVEHCKEISLRLSNMYSQAKKAQKAGQERVAPLSALDAGYSQGTSLTPPPPLGAPTEIKLRSSPLQSTADMPLHGDVPVQGSPKRMRLDDDGSWKEGKPSAVGAQAPPPAASPESSEPEEGEIL